ncbi:photosystem I assembly protein Ycf3 [Stieleria varia]|uniref:Photosystem I assembly protein Ycf3 n=2 Tax=Stieleria varia TaxID=2528005 RepID=A0A5C6B2C8_9BACT|nr:photosystem I assembly protein Ycf3 [Stieleria varia]
MGLQMGCVSMTDWSKATVQASAAESTDLRFGMARMIERNGSLSDAKTLYNEILKSNPDHTDCLHRLGVVSIQLEQLDQAIEYLSAAAAHVDASADLLGDLGYAYFLAGDYDTSEKTLREAVAAAPDNERLVNNLAIVVGYQGNEEESLALFRRVGTESESQSNMAFVLSGLGKYDAAKNRFHMALQRDPELKQAAKGLAEFYQPPDGPTRKSQAPVIAMTQ